MSNFRLFSIAFTIAVMIMIFPVGGSELIADELTFQLFVLVIFATWTGTLTVAFFGDGDRKKKNKEKVPAPVDNVG